MIATSKLSTRCVYLILDSIEHIGEEIVDGDRDVVENFLPPVHSRQLEERGDPGVA